jgi:hypothetical protein
MRSRSFIDRLGILRERISVVIATQQAGPYGTPAPHRVAELVTAMRDVEADLLPDWQTALAAMQREARFAQKERGLILQLQRLMADLPPDGSGPPGLVHPFIETAEALVALYEGQR